jgi:hypothetical protein
VLLAYGLSTVRRFKPIGPKSAAHRISFSLDVGSYGVGARPAATLPAEEFTCEVVRHVLDAFQACRYQPDV